MNTGTFAKAIVGAATAFGGTYATASLTPGTTTAEWVTIGVATVVGFAVVYTTPNSSSSDSTGIAKTGGGMTASTVNVQANTATVDTLDTAPASAAPVVAKPVEDAGLDELAPLDPQVSGAA